MSSIEERLVEDISAVTRGVVVTGSDLWEARTAVDDLIESRHRRPRRRTAALTAAAALAIGAVGVTAFVDLDGGDQASQLAGPGPDLSRPDTDHLTGSAPTPQLVRGVWRVDNGETMVRFDEDGSVSFDDRGTLFSRPVTTGTYAIAGDLVTVTITGDDQAECIGTKVAVRASFPEPGLLRYEPTGTFACAPVPAGQGALEQLLPTSRGMAELVFSQDTGWQPLSDTTALHGVWLAEGGGHLLQLGPDGSYYVVDDSGKPVDVGRWSFRDAALTLTSSDRSTMCSQGDELVLSQVEWVDPGTTAFRGNVAKNGCGGGWTPLTWILVPHRGS